MEKQTNTIPSTWKLVTLGEIGIVVSGGTPSTKDPEFWGSDVPWITPADLSNFDDIFISNGRRNLSKLGLEYSSAVLLPENSIIFSSRAPIGYVAIAKNPLATNQGFKNLILPKLLNPKYVFFYLKTIKAQAEELASGTTFLELSGSKFKQIPFPLPPIEEQDRIVEKLEELFSELDKNITLLSHSKLTADLTKSKFLDRFINGQTGKNELLSEITESISYGFTTKSYKKKKENSLQYLRITDIQDGKIDWEAVPFCDASKEDVEKFSIKPDDILFARSGNTVGKTIHISNTLPKSVFASYLINIRCNKKLLYPKFLSYFFQTDFFWEQIRKGITGIGQPNFNGTKVSNLIIPSYDLKTQLAIIEQIDGNFLEIDKLKKEIETTITKTTLLKSKILNEAFLGRLSKTFKSDTPTNILLNKIESEKDEFLQKQVAYNKKRIKSKIAKLDLIEIIKEKFASESFSYSDLYKSMKISKDKLLLEFEKLEVEEKIESYFDLDTGTIKYKLE